MTLSVIWSAIPTKAKVVLLVLVAVGIGYVFGYYFTSSKTKIKTQVITHTVVVDHHDIKTVTHVVHEPNGTTITDTTRQDSSTVDSNGNKIADKINTMPSDNTDLNWQVNALGGLNFKTGGFTYGADVQRKVFGPISAGAWGLSDGTVGISVGITF